MSMTKPVDRLDDRQVGKIGSYAFALITSAFLAWQCVVHDRRGEVIPPSVWMPCLLITGGALGVQIDLSSIGGALRTVVKAIPSDDEDGEGDRNA